MKNLKSEIRKLIASRLLALSFSIIPEGNFKTKYCDFLKDNIMDL
jgi:hypothetical protein